LHICADGEPERRLRQLVAGDLSGVLEALFREDAERESAGAPVVLTGAYRSLT